MLSSHEETIISLIKVISQKWLLANSAPKCPTQVASEGKRAPCVCTTVKQTEGCHRSAPSCHLISAAWTKHLIFMLNLTFFLIISVYFCLFFYLGYDFSVLNQVKRRNTRRSQSPNRGCWVESAWRCCVYFHLRWFRRSSAKEAASSWVSLLCSSCQKTGRDWVASFHSTFTVNVFHLWLWPVF